MNVFSYATCGLPPLFTRSFLDGYVPADLFGDLPFYFALSCSYLIVGVAWMILCAVFRYECIHMNIALLR